MPKGETKPLSDSEYCLTQVGCPFCEAKPGDSCTDGDHTLANYFHKARVWLAAGAKAQEKAAG